MATQEITISELELADEILGDMNIPVDTATETRAVTLKQLRAWLGSDLPVGSIFASVGIIDDERYTLLDGKTISRTGTYEAFCNKVVEKVQAGTWKACTEEEFNLEVSETGQCGKFVVSNDYVRIPKLGNSLCSGVIDGKIAVVGNGGYIYMTNSRGEGYIRSTSKDNVRQGGSLYITQGGEYSDVYLSTDPTKSGIEAKINSVEVFYYMVISTEGQTANVEIDINKVYEDLNLKATTDLSNVVSVAQSFKNASVGWGMPDFNSIIAWKANGGTIPYNCLLCAYGTGIGGDVYINGTKVAHYRGAGYESTSPNFFSYLPEGAVITMSGMTNVYLIPLKGAN